MYRLKSEPDSVTAVVMPEWVEPVAAACALLISSHSSIVSAVTVRGKLRGQGAWGRLLSVAETLAEKHDLEVAVDEDGGAVTLQFRAARP